LDKITACDGNIKKEGLFCTAWWGLVIIALQKALPAELRTFKAVFYFRWSR